MRSPRTWHVWRGASVGASAFARTSLLTVAIPEKFIPHCVLLRNTAARGRRLFAPLAPRFSLMPSSSTRTKLFSRCFTHVCACLDTASEDLISATCRLWDVVPLQKGVGCCRPNARFRRGLKRRSSCLMHAYHGVCKSPYLHNHNMHAFDTALPTKSVLHISCMNALYTLGRQILLTMFATNDV